MTNTTEKDAQKLFDKHLAAANAIPATDIVPMRCDAQLAYHNTVRGWDAVAPHVDRIRAELPALDPVLLAESVEIAMAVQFGASRVNRIVRSDGSLQTKMAEASELRRLMLAFADVLALAGVLPAVAVEKIRQGSGKLDIARDCVALAALYREHEAAIAGRSPVTCAQIDRAAAVGTELLELLRPASAVKESKTPEETARAAEQRDRLWTLLVRRHADLWRAGAYLFGRTDADDKVPSLAAYTRASKKAEVGA